MNIINLPLEERCKAYVSKIILPTLRLYNPDTENALNVSELCAIVQTAIEKTKSVLQLSSDLGHFTKHWTLDWHWISHHITWDYYNMKKAKTYLDFFGLDVLVYKKIKKTDCADCFNLYLTDPEKLNSKPKVFKLQDLINNHSNHGISKENFKPVIGTTDFGFYKYFPYGDPNNEAEIAHYWDNNYIDKFNENQDWNETDMEFKRVDKPLTDRQKKLRSLIKVTIGPTIYSDEEKKTK